MSLTCTRGKHEAAERAVRNQGLEFSRCRRCGRDLVRSGRSWRGVPRGFRVVWRSAAPAPLEASAFQHLLDLPSIGRALALLERPRRRGAVIVALELALIALRGLGLALAARFRAWLETLEAPVVRQALVLRLPAR
jgi:hypothetical protein